MPFQPPVKDLLPSIKLLQELQIAKEYKLQLAGHFLDGRKLYIWKDGKEFLFRGSSKIQKGLQTHKEIQFSRTDILTLKHGRRTFYVDGKHYLLTNIDYDLDKKLKLFSGSINSLSSSIDHLDINNKFLRMIIPLKQKADFSLNGFRTVYFKASKAHSISYIPVNFSELEYHLYVVTTNQKKYVILDCIKEEELVPFQKKCFNILLAHAFITGNLIHDECFVFSFLQDKMTKPLGFLFHSMRSSVITNMPSFTSNPYSVNSDIDFEREPDGRIKESVSKKLYDGMIDFPIDTFSNLALLFWNDEKLQRTALLFIQSHITSLESRIPNYYVAIEAITGYVTSTMMPLKSNLAPIKDGSLASELIEFVKQKAKDIKIINTLSDEEFNMVILEKNINKLNAPPNADKLSETFTFLGYPLSDEQKKILKERNTFLHGSFLKTIDDDVLFRQALHIALRIHFLIVVAVFKICGFSGKIINYAELWSYMTEKDLKEERLIKI